MVALLAEDTQRGVDDPLLRPLPAGPDAGVVGERGAAHHHVGAAVPVTPPVVDGGYGGRSIGVSLRRGHAGYDSARTLSLRAGTMGGASFQFGMPASSLAMG